jgi:uncharacterized protein YbjQ (UPF0145 family)
MSLWVFIQYVVPVLLILIGFMTGRRIEHNHWKYLAKSEKNLAHIEVTQHPISNDQLSVQTLKNSYLVAGNAVIAEDAFKSFIAKLRKLFGGELHGYQALLQRARRQAIIRMQHEAAANGAQKIINVRFASTDISSSNRVCVEVMVYGTAVS